MRSIPGRLEFLYDLPFGIALAYHTFNGLSHWFNGFVFGLQLLC
jgi:hypothetical protein